MNASSFRLRAVKFFLGGCVFFAGQGLRAEPFVPRDDQQVLERLRTVPLDRAARDLRDLRFRLSTKPDDLAVASQLAWRCIERSREEGDPRYLGHAQAALSPWWNVTQPPVEALILRATIEQSQHDFPHALNDLDLALQMSPTSAQPWLTRATILTVLGRYEEARRSCVPLVRLAPQLVAMTAAANVASLSGSAERSCALLRTALERAPSAKPTEKLWTLTLLAETSARLGKDLEAEEHFKSALALDGRDPYLLGAFSDFLLGQGRAAEVVALLKERTRVDPLLLRLALAEAALSPALPALRDHVNTLQARFESSRLRGDTVHRRERPRESANPYSIRTLAYA